MTEFIRHALPGVIEARPKKFGDDRGYFSEVFKAAAFAEAGIDAHWVQDNQSLSAQTGTIRGLHFQAPPFAQAKLVRVLKGSVYDVAVDIRRGSPDYGQWVGVTLTAQDLNQLYVPAGFAHGFMTLEPDTIVHYKVSADYSQQSEGAIRWDDPDLAIDWPALDAAPSLSEKDAVAPSFADLDTPFEYKSNAS